MTNSKDKIIMLSKIVLVGSLFMLICSCGGQQMPPPSNTTGGAGVPSSSSSSSPGIATSNPNQPANCIGIPVSTNGFGGCPMGQFTPVVGLVTEYVDTHVPAHHQFIRQERAPIGSDFDNQTAPHIVLHFTKWNPDTGVRESTDDGLGYWCSNDPNAELYFGLVYQVATSTTPAGWYAQKQFVRCNGANEIQEVSGPGYLIFADYPGDTGPETYRQCSHPGNWDASDATKWFLGTTCTNSFTVGWRTMMVRDVNGLPTTCQQEGPGVLDNGVSRFYSRECWGVSSSYIQYFKEIDSGNGTANTPSWLSMTLQTSWMSTQI